MKQNGFLVVEGKKLEYAWHGPNPKDALTLVFLHEGLGCVDLWRGFPAKVAEETGCGVLVYSRLGYGRSDPCPLPRPVGFMHEEGLRVLPRVIEAAGVREFVIIGHSDGGSIGIIYAGGVTHPMLRGIATEAAHVFCEDITISSIEQARESYINGDLKTKLAKFHGSNTDCAFFGWNGVWLNPEFVKWNIEEYLPGIKVPLMAMQGEKDQYGTIAQIEAIQRQAGRGARVEIIAECGHSPHLEKEKTVLNLIKNFVADVMK